MAEKELQYMRASYPKGSTCEVTSENKECISEEFYELNCDCAYLGQIATNVSVILTLLAQPGGPLSQLVTRTHSFHWHK